LIEPSALAPCEHRAAAMKHRLRETEAVAFVVTHAVGLDTNTAAADYIQLYQGDKATFIESLSFI
jgi:hypothetical protein